MICCVYKYNQIDKKLWNKVMKWIINGELKASWLLCNEKAFNEWKSTYKKTNMATTSIYFLKEVFSTNKNFIAFL
jgi:hypothetical protein